MNAHDSGPTGDLPDITPDPDTQDILRATPLVTEFIGVLHRLQDILAVSEPDWKRIVNGSRTMAVYHRHIDEIVENTPEPNFRRIARNAALIARNSRIDPHADRDFLPEVIFDHPERRPDGRRRVFFAASVMSLAASAILALGLTIGLRDIREATETVAQTNALAAGNQAVRRISRPAGSVCYNISPRDVSAISTNAPRAMSVSTNADIMLPNMPSRFKPVLFGATLHPNYETGLKISSVLAGSPAETAGLKSGDIIIAVNGKDLKFGDMFSFRDYITELSNVGPGGKISIEAYRPGPLGQGGKIIETTATLGGIEP